NWRFSTSPRCFSIRGPASVRGREQGSLTVQCRYDPKWKNYVKWWCKGAVWSSCQILVKTTESEWEKDRVSIRDNQRSHIFTVTMKELRRDDADTYWCGIERSGVDLAVQVVVIIDPGKRMWTTGDLVGRQVPQSKRVGTRASPDDAAHYRSLCPLHCRSFLSNVRFLLLVFLELPLLLSMVSAVLWVNRPQKSSGRRCNQPDYEKQ
uniref:Immunoglobulin domain-containing protein n=1 Tax=Rhinolophus ferrumequinum TaxID=59479 RepID=A0A671EV45_RHIFE